MANVKPFKALRFTQKAGDISQLVCPPYAIISEEERLSYLATNENNIIRLELPRETDDFYKAAENTLQKMMADGILKNDEEDAVYVYEIEFTVNGERNKIRGIITRVELAEFSKGIVLPHEETLSKAKQDRFNLMNATLCNFSQIYSLYSDEKRVTDTMVNNAVETYDSIAE